MRRKITAFADVAGKPRVIDGDTVDIAGQRRTLVLLGRRGYRGGAGGGRSGDRARHLAFRQGAGRQLRR